MVYVNQFFLFFPHFHISGEERKYHGSPKRIFSRHFWGHLVTLRVILPLQRSWEDLKPVGSSILRSGWLSRPGGMMFLFCQTGAIKNSFPVWGASVSLWGASCYFEQSKYFATGFIITLFFCAACLHQKINDDKHLQKCWVYFSWTGILWVGNRLVPEEWESEIVDAP